MTVSLPTFDSDIHLAGVFLGDRQSVAVLLVGRETDIRTVSVYWAVIYLEQLSLAASSWALLKLTISKVSPAGCTAVRWGPWLQWGWWADLLSTPCSEKFVGRRLVASALGFRNECSHEGNRKPPGNHQAILVCWGNHVVMISEICTWWLNVRIWRLGFIYAWRSRTWTYQLTFGPAPTSSMNGTKVATSGHWLLRISDSLYLF